MPPLRHRARFERVQKRHPEELEIVERLQIGAVDDRRALRLDSERNPGAREPRSVVRDERNVRDPSHADDARHRTRRRSAFDDRLEHVAVTEPVDRLADRVREGRPDGDHDLGRIRAGDGLSHDGYDLARVVVADPEPGRVDHVRDRLKRFPPSTFEPVAGARACVQVRIVHRRVDEPVRVDHGRGLEVVGRHPLALHADDRAGDVLEAASTSSSRRSSFAAREAKRAELSVTDEPSLYVGGRSLPDEGCRLVEPPSRPVAPPRPRARRPSSGPAGGPCRSRAADRPARARAPSHGRGCRPADAVPWPARRLPAAAASPTSRGRPPQRAFRHARLRVSPRRARSGRRLDEIGPSRAERVIDRWIEDHRPNFIGCTPSDKR